MSTAVRSRAKINLGLHIGAPRSDGFHELATVYQTLELHDVVTVTARPAQATALRITSNDVRVPTDERNTAWKMTTLALESLGISAEVEIHIDKRLPVQGGLGAGSANAAAALLGLVKELGLGREWGFAAPIEPKMLKRWGASLGVPQSDPLNEFTGFSDSANWPGWQLALAAKVGSDVPLFLVGGAVLGRDHGQSVFPLPDIEPTWCVVAVPEAGVSTPQAFRDWDSLCAAQGLTEQSSNDRLEQLSRAYASAFSGEIPEGGPGAGSSGVLSLGEDRAGPVESALVRTGISSWLENDFERVVFPQHPSLAEIKRILAGFGTPEAALHASLSGSGSALFGLYRTPEDAEASRGRLKEQVPEIRSTLTRTMPRSAYWREMFF
ncbi:MAG: 4-(cytidine 5'-diphospho)-2-C-methyl-D-erythritol kinase [Terracidiphilus sp.]|jgi:4-diphosphocytidyl-2-C-methyl-D-erythritol kinase